MDHARIDVSRVNTNDLERVSLLLTNAEQVSIVDENGRIAPLPKPLASSILKLVRFFSDHQSLILLPEDDSLTTQEVADHLGVSRQHVVDLLTQGIIPYFKVGSHRRVLARDLQEYLWNRDASRRSALLQLATDVEMAGLYDASFTGRE